jgi:hypothetical protein
MAVEVTKQLEADSKRDAKGCAWDVYQKECDRNDGLESEIEELTDEVRRLKGALLNASLFERKS